MKTTQHNLRSLIAKNARAFRERGLNSADLYFLDKLSSLARGKSRLVLTIAAVGRVCGLSRQGAHYRYKRLEAAGVVYRMHRVIFFNVKGFARWAVDAAKKRLTALSRSKRTKNGASVKSVQTHIQKTYKHKVRANTTRSPSADMAYQQAAMTPEQRERYWLRQMGLPERG